MGNELKKPGLPTHNLCVKLNGQTRWERVGVGWMNDFGAINLKVNPLIDLSRLGPGDILKVFPIDYNKKPGQSRMSSAPPHQDEDAPPDFGDDDIPA